MLDQHLSHTNSLFTNQKLNWLSACQQLEQIGEAYCIATVLADVGSVPRSQGAKMVISASHQFDTLGGGNLEQQVIKQARNHLQHHQQTTLIERFSLAADLGQCCGGAVQVLFEFMHTAQPKVIIFGAGHVSHALTSILRELPCHITVIDNRPDWLSSLESSQGVATKLSHSPADEVSQLPANAHLVIMTHDHSLDFDITCNALERDDFSFIGLIGSQGKKQRFSYRLKEKLTNPHRLSALTCPIGHPDIQGKLPMQVAVSIAAQLMERFSQVEVRNPPDKQQSEHNWTLANSLRKTLMETAS